MSGFDPSVMDGLMGAYKHFKALADGNHPPSKQYWLAMADMMAQTAINYLQQTHPIPPPVYTGPTIGPMPDKKEMERRERAERWNKIIEEWREYDKEKEQHLPH
jgi:hypothetical protein